MSLMRQTFLPAAAGIAVYVSSVALPVAGSYALARAEVIEQNDAPKLASLFALVGLFGGAFAGQVMQEKTRRRLALRAPRSEAEVFERI